MRRLTQPRVSCYYSPWRTGPLPPPLPSRSFSVSLSFSRSLSPPLPFTTERAKRPFVSTHGHGPRRFSDSDAGFIHPMDLGSVSEQVSVYCFSLSDSHAGEERKRDFSSTLNTARWDRFLLESLILKKKTLLKISICFLYEN